MLQCNPGLLIGPRLIGRQQLVLVAFVMFKEVLRLIIQRIDRLIRREGVKLDRRRSHLTVLQPLVQTANDDGRSFRLTQIEETVRIFNASGTSVDKVQEYFDTTRQDGLGPTHPILTEASLQVKLHL